MHNSIDASLNNHINLLHVGWEKCLPAYTYVNQRNIYLLHFIHSGKGYLQLNDIKYELSANDVFLIRPNQLATYTADKKDPWEYYYFAFNGDWAEELIAKTCFSNNCVCVKLKSDELFEHIKSAVEVLNDSKCIEFLSIEYLFKFFSCLYSKTSDKPQRILQQKNHYVSTLEEYIMFNYQKPLSVSELSKMFNLNRSHLHRLFKSQTGKSVEDFIIYVRLQEAKRFLRETSFSVTDISHLVGYNNYPSFFRMFKTNEGITPTEYRDMHSEISRPDQT
jgi:AraC-like DNA-binding protein